MPSLERLRPRQIVGRIQIEEPMHRRPALRIPNLAALGKEFNGEAAEILTHPSRSCQLSISSTAAAATTVRGPMTPMCPFTR